MSGQLDGTVIGGMQYNGVTIGEAQLDGNLVYQAVQPPLLYDDFERSSFGSTDWSALSGYPYPLIKDGQIYRETEDAKTWAQVDFPSTNMYAEVEIGTSLGFATNKSTIHICMDPAESGADFASYAFLNFNKSEWNMGVRETNGAYPGPSREGTWTLKVGDVVRLSHTRGIIYVYLNGSALHSWGSTSIPSGNRVGLTIKPGTARLDSFTTGIN